MKRNNYFGESNENKKTTQSGTLSPTTSRTEYDTDNVYSPRTPDPIRQEIDASKNVISNPPVNEPPLKIIGNLVQNPLTGEISIVQFDTNSLNQVTITQNYRKISNNNNSIFATPINDSHHTSLSSNSDSSNKSFSTIPPPPLISTQIPTQSPPFHNNLLTNNYLPTSDFNNNNNIYTPPINNESLLVSSLFPNNNLSTNFSSVPPLLPPSIPTTVHTQSVPAIPLIEHPSNNNPISIYPPINSSLLLPPTPGIINTCNNPLQNKPITNQQIANNHVLQKSPLLSFPISGLVPIPGQIFTTQDHPNSVNITVTTIMPFKTVEITFLSKRCSMLDFVNMKGTVHSIEPILLPNNYYTYTYVLDINHLPSNNYTIFVKLLDYGQMMMKCDYIKN